MVGKFGDVLILACLSACTTGPSSSATSHPADEVGAYSPAEAPKLWPDRFPQLLPKELEAAAAHHITPVPIVGPSSVAGIGAFGCPFKWVLAPDGAIYGLAYLRGDVIKHSVVTGGKPVLSAGYAVVHGGTIIIDDHSGHYHPDLASLALAQAALVNAGFAAVKIARDGVPVPSSDRCEYNLPKAN